MALVFSRDSRDYLLENNRAQVGVVKTLARGPEQNTVTADCPLNRKAMRRIVRGQAAVCVATWRTVASSAFQAGELSFTVPRYSFTG